MPPQDAWTDDLIDYDDDDDEEDDDLGMGVSKTVNKKRAPDPKYVSFCADACRPAVLSLKAGNKTHRAPSPIAIEYALPHSSPFPPHTHACVAFELILSGSTISTSRVSER